MYKPILFLIILNFGLSFNSLLAQPISIGSNTADYLRLMSIRNQLSTSATWNIQPFRYEWLSLSENQDYSNPWSEKINSLFAPLFEEKSLKYYYYTPEFFASYNSEQPSGGNDGALWQGRGLNAKLSTGIWAQYKFVEISFKPEFGYSQNLDYDLSPLSSDSSDFTYPFYNIDMPQRFGSDPISWSNIGNSYIKLFAGPAALGLSNQHHWFGPSWNNPIMMSNHAPGFRHVYLETFKPVETYIGNFEARWFWGKLNQSDYFSEQKDPGRYLTGIYFIFSPAFLENISIGFSRAYYESWPSKGITFEHITKVINPFYKEKNATDENPEGNDKADQIAGLTLRMAFPESGSEFYAEYFRTDHSWDYRDFILEPDHSRAYSIGGIITRDLWNSALIALQLEVTHLESPKTGQFRPSPPYYRNTNIKRGYTQEGQILGAAIGPGSNSQMFKASYFDKWGLAGIRLVRIVNDNDALINYFDRIAPLQGRFTKVRQLHNIIIHSGAFATILFEQLEFDIEIYRKLEYNHFYVIENDLQSYHFELTFRYRFDNFID